MTLNTDAARLYIKLLGEEVSIEMGHRPGTAARLERVSKLRLRALLRYRRRVDGKTELASRAGRELSTSERN